MSSNAPATDPWPPGDSEMARLVRAHDWAVTPLGPAQRWPERIKASVELVLASSLVSAIAIGGERLLIYNDAAAHLYGDRHPGALGEPLAETFPDSYPQVAALYDRVFAGESVQVAAQPLAVGTDGGGEVFDAYLTPVRDAGGAVIGAHMVGLEIGDRARAEAALAASEEKYRNLFDSIDAGFCVIEMIFDEKARAIDYRFVETNPAFERQSGLVNAAGRCISEFAPDLEKHWFERYGRVATTGEPMRIEGEVAPLGRWFDINAFRVAAPEQRRVAVQFTDITARRVAEEALREGEARLAGAFESVPVGLSVIGLDGAAIVSNPEYRRFLPNGIIPSRDPASVARWRAWDADGRLLPPDEFPGARAFRGERTVPGMEMRYTDDDGREIWTSVATVPIYDSAGAMTGQISVITDIDDRKRAEAALRESEERQTFLLKFSDAIRAQPNDHAVVDLATRMLSEEMRLDRCYAAAMYPAEDRIDIIEGFRRSGLPPMPSQLRFSDFPEAAKQSFVQTLVFHDAANDPALSDLDKQSLAAMSFGAHISPPLRQGAGNPIWAMGAVSSLPRHWTPGEVALVEDVAERTWAAVERVRAEHVLRETEERLQQFGAASQDVLWIRDVATSQWTYLSAGFEATYGVDRDTALRGDNLANWSELIVPEDRERALANLRRVASGEQMTFEFRIRRPSDGDIRWMQNTDFPIRDSVGDITRIGGVGHDITRLKRIEQALAAAERRQRALLEGIPQLVWRAVDGGHWTWASPQWTDFTGQAEPASHGRGWLDPVHPDDRENVMDIWASAVERGEFTADYRLHHAGDDRYRWFQTRATPVRDDDGAIIEWLGTSTDVDDIRELQQRQEVLVAELQHRVRNILTVVRSVFGRTMEAGGEPEDIADHFRGRLESLARTQVVTTRNATGTADLENLIRDELLSVGVSDGPRITIEGPDVVLPAKAVESIGLAIHELTTNALKYGALKGREGSLDIRWRINIGYEGARRLVLTWREQGVPAVAVRPTRHGFGTELITEALPYRLGAETKLEFLGGGIRCTIDVPLPEFDGSARVL